MKKQVISLLVAFMLVPACGWAQSHKKAAAKAGATSAAAQKNPDETAAPAAPAASAAQPAKPKTATPEGEAQGGKFTLDQFERSSMDQAVAEKQRQISVVRRQNIQKLLQLLTNPHYENKDQVYHRLAEAYWEQGLYDYLEKRREFEKASDQFQAGTLSERPTEPIEDYSQSLEYYRKILREFPQYPRIDEVMYYLGKGALKDGKSKKDRNLLREGVERLNRLVQNYPKSRFIAESYLALGEYYFETNSLYYAKTNYEKIITNFSKSSMYNYALYKLGWVYFNLHEFDTAIETFKKVVAQVAKAEGKGIIEFKNQAMNDLVVTYAEVDDGWVHAKDYFLKMLTEEQAYKKLRALGDLYVGQDKDIYAIQLFRHFIEREKTTPAVVEYYKIILDIYKKTNDLAALDQTTLEVLDYLKPNGTWWTANSTNQQALDDANGLCEQHLSFLANHYHREAQRLNKADLYKKAADKYALYLTRFSDSKQAYIVNYYYAEILYDQLKDYKAAGEQYQKVIARDTKGEYVEDAALGVIYCYEEQMVAAGLQERAKKGNIEVVKVDPKKLEAPIPETDLNPLEVEYIKASDKYVELLRELIKDPEVRKKNPERGEKIPEIMYIAAQVYYRHGKFQDAVSRLKVLFDYDPSTKFAAYSVFTLLDCYQRLQQWPRVEEWARKLIAAKNFSVKSEKDLKKIVAVAMTENARFLSEGHNYDEATKEAMRVYEEFKGNEDMSSKALFNVAALYESQKNTDAAVKTYLRVVREFPKSDVAPEALFTVGLIYESQTEFEKAAATFEDMERFKTGAKEKEPTDEEKKKVYANTQKQISDSLQNAGLIREALGQYKDAIEVYQKFVKLFPNHPDTPKVDLRIGLVYEMMDNAASYKKAHDHYQTWLKKPYKGVGPQVVEALTRAGADLKKIDAVGQRKAASALFSRSIEAFGKLGENADALTAAKAYAAQAAFELADYSYDDFNALKIPSTLDPKILKKALLVKAEAQVKADKAFNSVMDYKSGGWSAGALFKIGLLYYEFAHQLFDVPVPEGLPVETQDEYRLVLEDIARPVEEKSLKAFERALKLAHDEKVYNKFSKACGQYAVKVNQDTFPVAGDDQVKPDHEKDTLASISFIRTLRRGNFEVKMIEEAK